MASVPLPPGTLLNQRYSIQEALGQGGMGTVYKAEHVRLHAVVAVKEIRAPGGEDAQSRLELETCEHEARFLVNLNHPHLPKVTDAFIENDNFYLVMDYIQGVTLESHLSAANGAPLDVLQSVEWGLQIADVLAYLHSQDPPIIFRDLKPSNVMIQPDSGIKLIDFGIARHFQPGALKDTSLLGSVGYSPPEQFGKGQTDPRSDVYAFGATLHHLLTGRDPALQPFKFPPARTFNPQVPDSLSHLLDMCLEIDPNHRPETINVVAVQLLGIREELIRRRVQIAAQQAARAAGGLSPAGQAEKGTAAARANRGDAANPNAPSDGTEPKRSSMRITSASGAMPRRAETSTKRSAAWMIVPIVLVIIGSGAVLAVKRNNNLHANVPTVTSPVIVENSPNQPEIGADPAPHLVTPSPSPGPVAPASTTPALSPPLVDPNISLQTALLPVANDLLPIVVSGSMRGQANAQSQLAVYFYDSRGVPLNAIEGSDPAYMNIQKYLCAYKTLNVVGDDYAIQETFSLPVRLLTGVTQQPGPFTYQAILFLNGKPVSETPRNALPVSAYGNTSSTPPGSPNNPQVPKSTIIHEGGKFGN